MQKVKSPTVTAAWRRSVVVSMLTSTLGPVTTWMGDCLRAGKPSGYVCNQPSRSTQSSTLCGMVKWVSAFRLSNNDGDGGCSFIAAYRRANGWSLIVSACFYSRVFDYFCQMSSKPIRKFELYCYKVFTFFRHSVVPTKRLKNKSCRHQGISLWLVMRSS